MLKRKLMFLITTSFLALASCGGGSGDTSKYQKVSKAFNAVEKVFERKSSRSLIKLANFASGQESALNTLDNLFASYVVDETLDSQIDYDTPPLIQFKYLKTIYEGIGSSYDFGVKYYDIITGEMYLDIESGFKYDTSLADKDEHKYNYSFNMSASINIDANDDITSKIAFDINLVKGSENYNYQMYVRMELDYDFSKDDNSNFTLAIYSESKDKELPYYDTGYNYEYNYVDVRNGEIIDWRKLLYDASIEMNRDVAHQYLDSYLNDGIEINNSNQRWYKNNQMRRIDSTDQNAFEVSKILFSEFGLNASEIGRKEYLARSGNKSNVIANIYRDASRVYGDDLIYHLITKDDDSDEGNWPGQIIRDHTSQDLPIFSSKEGIKYYIVEQGYRSIVIDIIGATRKDYEDYASILEQYGFIEIPSQNENIRAFYLLDNANAITVSFDINANKLSIAYIENEGGEAGTVYLDNGINFEGYYKGYNYLSIDEDYCLNFIVKATSNEIPGEAFMKKIDMSNTGEYVIYMNDNIDNLEGWVNGYSSKYVDSSSWVNLGNNFFYQDKDGKEYIIFTYADNPAHSINIVSIALTETIISSYQGSSSEGGDNKIEVTINIYHWGQFDSPFTEKVENNINMYQYCLEHYNALSYIDPHFHSKYDDTNSYSYSGMNIYINFDDPMENNSYYLSGSFNNWSEENPIYQLTKGEDGLYHFSGLNIGRDCEIKVMSSNHIWYGRYGNSDPNNYVIEQAGQYDVTFQPIVDNGIEAIQLTRTGDYDEGEVEFRIVGTINGINRWDYSKGIALDVYLSYDTGIYWTENPIHFDAGDAIKIVGSNNVWYPGGEGNDYVVEKPGEYKIFFNRNSSDEYANRYFTMIKQ